MYDDSLNIYFLQQFRQFFVNLQLKKYKHKVLNWFKYKYHYQK